MKRVLTSILKFGTFTEFVFIDLSSKLYLIDFNPKVEERLIPLKYV